MEDGYFLPISMSSSLFSSSSSVRNPYDYNSNIKKPKNSSSKLGYEFQGVKCKCDLPAPCQEAWKEGTLDSERRLFGYSQYKDPRKKCNFFLWADPSYPDRARDVIKGLKVKLKRKKDEMHNVRVDMSFLERKMLVLNEEVVVLRKKNEDAVKNYSRVKKLFVLATIVIIVMWLLK